MDFCFSNCRAIVWLQNKRDATLERARGPSPRREDAHEYRVGRLKHERVTIPRNEGILEWASQVMHFHADRKSVLEVNLDSIFPVMRFQLKITFLWGHRPLHFYFYFTKSKYFLL